MKQPLIILAFICGLLLGIGFADFYNIHTQSDELNNLRIQNSFLHDYKKAYLEHVEMCDSLHEKCFRAKP